MVGALEPLGRHGDALEVRVPSAQHQGLNLHNLLARRVGVGSCATLAWGKGQPRMPSGLWPPLPYWLRVQVRSCTGTTWYSPDSDPGAQVCCSLRLRLLI